MQIQQIEPQDLHIHPSLAVIPTQYDVLRRASKENAEEISAEWQALVASVKESGILEPLKVVPSTVGGWLVVDGRHRLRAAEEAGLATVPCAEVPEAEIDAIILGSVIGRRHLSKFQLAFLGVCLHPEVCGKGRGGDRKSAEKSKSKNDFDLTQSQLAEKVGVSYGLVNRAVTLFEEYHDSPANWEKLKLLVWSGVQGIEAGMGFLKAAETDPAKVTKAITPGNTVKEGRKYFARLLAWEEWTPESRKDWLLGTAETLSTLPPEARRAMAEALEEAEKAAAGEAEGKVDKKKIQTRSGLFTCPLCKVKNFTDRGLRAHVCPENNNQRLTNGMRLAAMPSGSDMEEAV